MTAKFPDPGSASVPPNAAAGPIRLRVPNARSGEAYRAKFEPLASIETPIRILRADIPPEIGLEFDAETGELHGTPRAAGDHKIGLRCSDGTAEIDGECLLIVIANPKDLWKNLPTDPDAPYFKSNEHGHLIEAPDFHILAASKRGRSHAHAGAFREDDFYIAHDAATGWSVLVVADGAGSAKFSRKGSELAAHTAGESLLWDLKGVCGAALMETIEQGIQEAADHRKIEDSLGELFGKSARAAFDVIDKEAHTQGASNKDFSTTLLAMVVLMYAEGVFVASLWVGDGAVAAYLAEAEVCLLGAPDTGEYAGQTRFLDGALFDDSYALASRIAFGCFYSFEAMILMTDGISDPRFETDSGLADGARWAALWEELVPHLESANPAEAVLGWMDFFQKGHHDDRTMVVLWPKG